MTIRHTHRSLNSSMPVSSYEIGVHVRKHVCGRLFDLLATHYGYIPIAFSAYFYKFSAACVNLSLLFWKSASFGLSPKLLLEEHVWARTERIHLGAPMASWYL